MSPGRSHGLLDLVSDDLPGHVVERRTGGAMTLVPGAGGPSLHVDARVERRFLGRTEIARFTIETSAPFPEPARLGIHHTGARHRIGLEARVRQGGESTERLARVIETDDVLVSAALPLDFTHFDVTHDGASWRTTVELMGAALVAMAFPPMRSYVRLHADQREALLETFKELERLLSGT
ncbi:MAG: DUF3156 family protein [Actinobacteria bacterium]|nr:DUF3156 family protein [Actinomycetota bacterium]